MTLFQRISMTQFLGKNGITLRSVCKLKDSVMRSSSRLASQGSLKVEVIDEKKGIGEICLQNPPVNTLHSGMLTGLVDGVKSLEKDGCRAFLLTSNVPGIFSAGLNLLEMYNQQREDLLQYWARVQEMFLTLYGSRLITVACVTGAAPAAGCLLATSCDYRLMVDQPKAVIGLNESLVGLPVPDWMRINFCDVVGRRQTDLALQMGLLFPAQEALRIGLVDQVVDSPEKTRQLALKSLDQFLKVPDVGRVASKKASIEPLVSYLSGRLEKDRQLFVDNMQQEAVQNVLGKYLERLRNKANK